MSRYVDNVEFVTELCCKCGIAFAMTADFQRRRVNDHASFYCPAGHGNAYTGPNEAQKLRDDLARTTELLESARAHAQAEKSRRRHSEKAHKRMRVRVMNGVCPCCNRTFQNLLNHMRTEHPDYASIGSLRHIRELFGLTQNDVAKEALVRPAYVSKYEHDKPIPERSKRRIDEWIACQSEKPTP